MKNNGHALFANYVMYMKNVKTTKLDFYDFKKDYFSVCVLYNEVSASDIYLLCSAAVAATVSE